MVLVCVCTGGMGPIHTHTYLPTAYVNRKIVLCVGLCCVWDCAVCGTVQCVGLCCWEIDYVPES